MAEGGDEPFARALAFVLAEEGGFQADPADPGNWTGGAVGAGELRGTKWGISAAAFPKLDIAALTEAEAAAIYRTHYWRPLGADALPAPLAFLLFDAAVMGGPVEAVRLLQRALGVAADGILGPLTRAAAKEAPLASLTARFQAERLAALSALPGFARFGEGWTLRLFRGSFIAGSIQ
jgi:lysozyme family protein